mmetsp:Transcript_8654/g.14663  ORF Transcript_8654/g.14663 Transcript_8654/m.14663 type:complete len:106 (+) Transcript_8654:1591-1908(+)
MQDTEADDRNKQDQVLQIDQLFGKIFGIERVHILQKSDKLEDVIEKISIVPESKLVYVEKQDDAYQNQNGQQAVIRTAGGNYVINNIFTMGDLLTFLLSTTHVEK